MIRLTDWCKQNGISYTTAWRLRRDDKFPHPTVKVGRTVFVVEDELSPSDERIWIVKDGSVVEVDKTTPTLCPHCGESVKVILQ